ncbi:hypothetical protein SISNIDRAFT_451998 [Sistotremastrum niveocremeum HHB9708]|uniref:Uncharacterized protein n=1 Tax=Sistotremastrum niveocremeum HHB9708 TaxID=1314777 RepID=A0A164WVG3_9AGAM|nr:hypothetical protein SISNIDRAFT_451998 [Sistotremastrum niveocremeum HHB9708]
MRKRQGGEKIVRGVERAVCVCFCCGHAAGRQVRAWPERDAKFELRREGSHSPHSTHPPAQPSCSLQDASQAAVLYSL